MPAPVIESESSRSLAEAREALKTEDTERMTRALARMWGAEPVLLRTMGGTVPISPFIQALGFPAISLPIVNFDNNQHGPNENVRIRNVWQAMESMAALLTMQN